MQETQETQVLSLGGEDLLEREVAAHPSNLAWRIPWTEEPGGLPSMESRRARQDQSDLARTQQKRRVPSALGTHRLVKASETPIAHAGCWGQAAG